MTTPTEVLTRHNVELSLDDETIAEIDVPVLATMQRQGDVMIRPVCRAVSAGGQIVPPEGVALVVGEATGNAHMLAPEPGGRVWWRPAQQSTADVVLGEIHVEDGSSAWLIHTEEHAVIGIAPGVYEARGKRTQREAIVRVQD